MTGNEYQKLAMRTCNISNNKKNMLYHGVFGLTSEAGEVAGLLQKIYQGHILDDVMQTNIDKLKARYPTGFDPDKSLHRKDGDV